MAGPGRVGPGRAGPRRERPADDPPTGPRPDGADRRHARALAVAVILLPLRGRLAGTDVALVLVLAVVAVAANGLRLAGWIAAVSSALWFDFFWTRPHEQLAISARADVETSVLLLALGVAVTETAVWGRHQHLEASREAGFRAGILAAAEAVATGDSPSAVIDRICERLAPLLGLQSCRFDYGTGRDHPRLEHDGSVVWRHKTVDADPGRAAGRGGADRRGRRRVDRLRGQPPPMTGRDPVGAGRIRPAPAGHGARRSGRRGRPVGRGARRAGQPPGRRDSRRNAVTGLLPRLRGAFVIEAVLTFALVSTVLGTASAAQNLGALSAFGVGAYDIVYLPRNIPHAYRITSERRPAHDRHAGWDRGHVRSHRQGQVTTATRRLPDRPHTPKAAEMFGNVVLGPPR